MGGQDRQSGVVWTLQQFWTGPAGKPWCALQQHSDAGLTAQFTGYRQEIEDLCQSRKIDWADVQPLAPISEAEFYRQQQERFADEPDAPIPQP